MRIRFVVPRDYCAMCRNQIRFCSGRTFIWHCSTYKFCKDCYFNHDIDTLWYVVKRLEGVIKPKVNWLKEGF